jgi:hypothetical protein
MRTFGKTGWVETVARRWRATGGARKSACGDKTRATAPPRGGPRRRTGATALNATPRFGLTCRQKSTSASDRHDPGHVEARRGTASTPPKPAQRAATETGCAYYSAGPSVPSSEKTRRRRAIRRATIASSEALSSCGSSPPPTHHFSIRCVGPGSPFTVAAIWQTVSPAGAVKHSKLLTWGRSSMASRKSVQVVKFARAS